MPLVFTCHHRGFTRGLPDLQWCTLIHGRTGLQTCVLVISIDGIYYFTTREQLIKTAYIYYLSQKRNIIYQKITFICLKYLLYL